MGNLPWKTREAELEEHLLACGVTSFIKVEVVLDRETGRSRGFGFVHFAHNEEDDALPKLQGSELGGRELTVDRATARQRERDERRSGGGGGGGRGGRGDGQRSFEDDWG